MSGRLGTPELDTLGWSRGQETEEARRYGAYRRRQATRLLDLLPREAVRPLYRRAAEYAVSQGRSVADSDPMGILLEYCERLLALPPMDVWRQDLLRYPEGHLTDLAQGPAPPTAHQPVTLAVREIPLGEVVWRVHLEGFRADDAWRGRMVFHGATGEAAHATAAVFRESDPLALRARFRSFDLAALRAFFRSALP